MVTDEMLKRAIEAYAKDTGAEGFQLEGWIEPAIRAALEAALSTAEPKPDFWDVEEAREQKLATVAAPDNGTTEEILSAVLECAEAWVPEARIIGNVRAGDIARAARTALSDEPTLWVSPVDLRAWKRDKAGEIWAWPENLEGQCVPLYAAPPAPSVAVKAAREILNYKNTLTNMGCATEKYLAELADLATALSAQVQDVAGWQTIETAPKDGSSIDLGGISRGEWSRWCEAKWAGEEGEEEWTGPWSDGFDCAIPDSLFIPTHWMPLPASPAKQEGSNNG